MIKECHYKATNELEMYYRYYDKDGREIKAGDYIKFDYGDIKKVYASTSGELNTDATNPSWIKSGRARPCQYGLYPLNEYACSVCKVMDDYKPEPIKVKDYEAVITLRFDVQASEIMANPLITKLIGDRHCIEYGIKEHCEERTLKD